MTINECIDKSKLELIKLKFDWNNKRLKGLISHAIITFFLACDWF